ncbi:MAG: glycosyltransferase family 2 protein [Aeromonas popoffii]|uniref:glycosyltransferase family 2 protein n=1 Tax=Aeromonas popoffii TaxID=70856 RepID=UPI003F3465DA
MKILFHLTEAEITANWSVDEPIRVSVCCITYKQEQYISQAIDSFLMQKTTFPFEIIVGEDCGGDGTLSILYAYQKYYPNVIKVVKSEKNIGANSNLLKLFNMAQGDYIAVCEGDDYWCDENKLQKQYEYIEKTSDCTIVVHPASALIDDKVKNISWPCQERQNSDFIFSAKAQFSPTSSYFFRRNIIFHLPEWFIFAPVGDYYIETIASSIGECALINEYMSVYRVSAENSWSERLKKDKTGIRIVKTYESNIECLIKLANILPQYKKSIDIKISHAEYACALGCLESKDYNGFRKHMNKSNTKAWYDLFHRYMYMFRGNKFFVFSFLYLKTFLKLVIRRR